MTKTVIDLLRHGEVHGGACFRGSQNDPLTKAGWQQMQQQTHGKQWQAIISSPLQRCQSFATKLSQQHAIPLQHDSGFQEIHFGDWEGKSAEYLQQHAPLALERFYQNPAQNPPPNAEPFGQFQARVATSWQRLLDKHSGQHILLITHGGVIRHILAHTLNLSFQQSLHIAIPYACLTRLHHYPDKPQFTQLVFHQPPE